MEKIPTLSPVEGEILRLLIASPEMYGLELVTASAMLKRGTIYVTLARMTDKGFVCSRTVKSDHEPGLPRRLFKVTGYGQTVFRVWEAARATLRLELA
jgi:DNA-binding PadR family transcriptional regulator